MLEFLECEIFGKAHATFTQCFTYVLEFKMDFSDEKSDKEIGKNITVLSE